MGLAISGLLDPSAATGDGPTNYRIQLSDVRTIDGSGNGTGGAAGSLLLRKRPASYPDDGSGATIIEWPERENPRTISNVVVNQSGRSVVNNRRRSDYLWAWGQFLDHDLDLSDNGVAFGIADIPIPDPSDPLGPAPIPFSRSEFAPGTGVPGIPREQLNRITSFIDASNVYGSDAVRAAALRTFSGGQLKTSAGNLLPFNVDGLPNGGGTSPEMFLAGDIRVNENVVLISMHTLFVREHNRLATLIALLDPDATDEEIYQLARKIVGAEMQQITYGEFLPAVLGPYAPDPAALPYDPGVVAAIANEFSTAFFRFGHTLLSANLKLSGAGFATERLPLRNAFFSPSFVSGNPINVDRLLIGAQEQLCQEVDNMIIDDVRNFLFGPPGAGGMDLASLNLQRGRDHGLPDYNSLRAAYGLPRVNAFSEITSKTGVQWRLSQVYVHVDEIDPWIGGLTEDHLPGASVGPMLQEAFRDQFRRLFQGDRFNYRTDADLGQSLVRAVVDLPSLNLAEIVRMNTVSKMRTPDIFCVDNSTYSDVVVTHDVADNRVHITGNGFRNIVVVLEVPTGLVIHGLGTSQINGQALINIPTALAPHLTIDLGGQDDRVYLLACHLSDLTVSLGDGSDRLMTFLCEAQSLAADFGPAQDAFTSSIQVPPDKVRILNLP
jgi:hypothetical protein